MKKFLVVWIGIGVVFWLISSNNNRNQRQIELAADISCATFKAWEKYGMTSGEVNAKNIDVRQAVQDTVLPVLQKYKLSETAFRSEYAKIKERMSKDFSFRNDVAYLMQKKGCKAPELTNK